MAVKIRLSRVGTRNRPHYRIVVADQNAPRDARSIEVVGHYDPKKGIASADVRPDRIRYWLGCGAKPTGIVRQIMKKAKLTVAEQTLR